MGVAALQQTLLSHKLLCIDTNVLIYLLDNHPHYVELSATIMRAIETGQVLGVTSMLTLAEVLTQPARMGNHQVLQDYELYLTNFPNLTLQPVDAAVAREAVRVRGAYKVKLPDAIQLATARLTNADGIISNDKDWRGKTGAAALLLLDDYL
jgi:predicted nucleic acid-binding protein